MKALLQYVQQVIASGQDGTISALLDTGEIGTLTVRKRSIVAASLEDSTGKAALESLKLAKIVHMELWKGILRKNDVHKMVVLQSETNALSPIPEDELCPEGAPIEVDENDDEDTGSIDDEESDTEADEKEDLGESEIKHEPEETLELSSKHIEALTTALLEYVGPAADILIQGAVEQANTPDELIELLCKELFSDKERDDFAHTAFFILGQT